MSEKTDENSTEEAKGTAHPVKEEEVTQDQNGEELNEMSPESKLAQLEKDYLYLRAEMENVKRHSIKERSQLLKFGAERLARDLLDTLDVFKSALGSDVNKENFSDFVNGIQMTMESLNSTLAKHGIKEVPCVGQPFDPNTQEALSSEFKEDIPEGHVTQVFKAPYIYHDKLLRAGQVVVSRGKTD